MHTLNSFWASTILCINLDGELKGILFNKLTIDQLVVHVDRPTFN